MAITNEFKEAVEAGKKIRVRIMLKDIMLVDPTMKQFDEMISYASGKMTDLYDEHNDEILNYSSSDWNEAYLNSQMVTVVNNFSKERVELLRNMVKYIYREKADCIRKADEFKTNTTITRKQVGVGAAAVGTVAAVAGICAHEGLLIAGGAAVMAVGIGLILTDGEG